MKRISTVFCMCIALGWGAWAFTSCSYHNDDDQNRYDQTPDPDPEPSPEPTPEAYLAALATPNCVMVAPGGSASIAVLKAYAIWAVNTDLLGVYTLAGQPPEASLVWQDEPGLISGLRVEGTNEYAKIIVETSRKTGNAVVAATVDGAVRWSWHVWVTEYDPDGKRHGTTRPWDNDGDGRFDYEWMDRNLGALTDGTSLTHADSLSACGLLYQWGRKDPFAGDRTFRYTTENNPPNFDSKPVYDIRNVPLPETGTAPGTGIHTVKRDADDPSCGLGAAIRNPMILYIGVVTYSDWYASATVRPDDRLWGMDGAKSAYDPCPEGWRVPAFKNAKAPWNGADIASEYSTLGVFPKAGFRYTYNGGALKNSGFQVCLWSANASPGSHGRILSANVDYTGTHQTRTDVSNRSTAASVRCVKE